MASKIDPHNSWIPLRERAAQTANALHKTLLEEVANHMEAEITGQLQPLMNTLTAEPVYHFWRVGPENLILNGYAAVEGFYSDMFARNGQQFEVVLDRIVVDDGGVVTEGQVKQVYRRSDLLAQGVPEAAVQGSDLWMSNAQLITVWPNDGEGKLVGEDIYFGEDPMQTLVPVNEDDLPPYYIL